LGVPEVLAESKPLEPDTCNQVVGKVSGIVTTPFVRNPARLSLFFVKIY